MVLVLDTECQKKRLTELLREIPSQPSKSLCSPMCNSQPIYHGNLFVINVYIYFQRKRDIIYHSSYPAKQ